MRNIKLYDTYLLYCPRFSVPLLWNDEYNIGNDTLKIDGRVHDVIVLSRPISQDTLYESGEHASTLRSGLLSSTYLKRKRPCLNICLYI